MSQLNEARMAWQRAQADLQVALADLERLVASEETPERLEGARQTVAKRQETADLFLARYITQLGKSRND